VSDINDQYPHDDPDVIERAGFVSSTNGAQKRTPARVVAFDRGGPNEPAPPSSGSRDLAAMLMFDLDYVEAER
jgi:hypothetical protein